MHSAVDQDWIRRTNRLLSMETGSFRTIHWNEAEDLMSVFEHQTETHSDIMNREQIEHGFELLDRLSDELSGDRAPGNQLNVVPNDENNITSLSHEKPLWDRGLLRALILAWKKHVLSLAISAQRQQFEEQSETDAVETDPSNTASKGGSIKGLLSSWWDYIISSEEEAEEKRPLLRFSPSPQVVASLNDLSPNKIFHKVHQYFNSGLFPPNVIPYNDILRVTAKVEGDPRKVEEMVDWLFENHKDNRNVKLSKVTLLEVLSAWRYAGNPDQCEKALLRYVDMVRKDQGKQIESRAIDPKHFNVAIVAWSESKEDEQAAERATALFELMQTLGHSPNMFCFNSLLSAWARSNSIHAVENLERLFKGMKEEMVVKPDATVYATLMAAYARHNRLNDVEHLFAEMKNASASGMKPSWHVYVTRLHAWSKAGHPEKTAEILGEIIQLHEQGESNVEISTRTFNPVLTAWLRSQRENAAEMAEKGLSQMLQFSKEKRFDCHPDVFSFNTVISAYGERLHLDKSNRDDQDRRHSVYRILVLVKLMKEIGVQPDMATYRSLMSVWAHQGRPEQVEKVFQEIQKAWEAWEEKKKNNKGLEGDGSGICLKPCLKCYHYRLNAWSKAGNPEMCAKVLDEMIAHSERGVMDDVKPSRRDFSMVIHAWLRSGRLEAGEQGELQLQRMKELCLAGRFDCYPDVIAYTAAISCWSKASSSSAAKATQHALGLLQELKALSKTKSDDHKSFEPNTNTYTEVMRILLASNIPTEESASILLDMVGELRTRMSVDTRANDDLKKLLTLERAIESSVYASNEALLNAVQSLCRMVGGNSYRNARRKMRG